jgi:hypothetical protein
MGNANFSEEFKRDAVAQITERGYPVAEVSKPTCGDAERDLGFQLSEGLLSTQRRGTFAIVEKVHFPPEDEAARAALPLVAGFWRNLTAVHLEMRAAV